MQTAYPNIYQQNKMQQPIQTKERDKFYHRSLEALQENEMNIKQYWSKTILVTIPSSQFWSSELRFRGKFSCCDDAGWIVFNEVIYEKHPEKQFLQGAHFPEYHAPCIDDIVLIEEVENNGDEKDQEIKANDNNASYRLGKSIKNIIFDVMRLKLVHKALSKLPLKYPDIEPLSMYNRKLYFKKSTHETSKKSIGDCILNMKKIPDTLYKNSLFASAFQSAMVEDDKTRSNLSNYNLDDALSLLRDYHDLWIEHIQKHNGEIDKTDEQKKEKEIGNIVSASNYFNGYIQWDDWESLKISYSTRRPVPQGMVWNSEDIYERSLYSKPYEYSIGVVPITIRKVENVYVESIWPYHFKGPFTKLKKNNPDWLCMKCLKECIVPFVSIPIAKDDNKENIYFYKANGSLTMEVCYSCIDACLFAQKWKKRSQKQLKASKRYYKRLKKKLAEYAEKEIPWTPPIILSGMPFYGIHAPVTGPIYSLPYPQLPSYMPGMTYVPPMTKSGMLGPTYPPISNSMPYPNYGVMGPTYSLRLPTYIPGMKQQPISQSTTKK